jgi:hypothetical protein
VTLCYFQLLQAVKDSEFLNPDLPALATTSAASPLFLRRIGQKWIGVGDGSASSQDMRLHLQPLIISLDALPVKFASRNESLEAHPAVLKAIDALDHKLRHEMTVFESAALRFDPDLCYRTSQRECFVASYKYGDAHSGSSRSTVLTYAFAQGTDDAHAEWLKKLPAQLEGFSSDDAIFTAIDSHRPPVRMSADPQASLNKSAGQAARGLGISLPLSPKTGETTARFEPSLRQIKNFSWVFYATKAFVMRFWALAKVRLLDHFPFECAYRKRTES